MGHHIPGAQPAFRVITGNLASPEQRAAAFGLVGDVAPEDIIFAARGETRLPTDAEMIEIMGPQQFRCTPASRWDRWIGWATVTAAFLAGLIVGELLAVAQIVGRV